MTKTTTSQLFKGYWGSATIVRNQIKKLDSHQVMNMKAYSDYRKAEKAVQNHVAKWTKKYPDLQQELDTTVRMLKIRRTRICNLPEQN